MMPFNIFSQRIISSDTGPSPTFIASDRDTAISLALDGTGTRATPYGRLFTGWPGLKPYSNDNAVFTFGPPPPDDKTPQYLWADTITAGERLGFAVASATFSNPAAEGGVCVVSLTVFGDNAHTAVVTIVAEDGVFVANLTPSGVGDTPIPLVDGSMAPIDENPPFNWQDIRYYSNEIQIEPGSYRVVVSFEAQNYVSPPEIINPAGLAFVADIRFIFFEQV